MFLYDIGIFPLIQKLKELYPEGVQPWCADDAAVLAEWFWLVLFYEDLLLYGKSFGYFPNPAKYKVVVHPSHVVAADEFSTLTGEWGLKFVLEPGIWVAILVLKLVIMSI